MATPRSSSNSGGVKNLRAMFENKNSDPSSTSPPSRGRSPAGSDASIVNSSRPVSKVRTSFVAVERPGEGQQQMWGLRKASDVSSMAEVKEEAGKERHMGISENKSADETDSRQNGSLVGVGTKKDSELALDDTVQTSSPTKAPSATPRKTPNKAKMTETETASSKAEKIPEQTTSNTASDKAVEQSDLPKKLAQGTKKTNGALETQPESGNLKTASSVMGAVSDKANLKSSAGNRPTKTSPTIAATTQSDKPRINPSQKQPVTKGAANKAAAVMTSAQTASVDHKSDSKVAKRPSQPSLKAHVTTKTSAAMTKASPTSPKGNRTQKISSTASTASPASKTRPRSPTRPVRLPASATAQTASSAAKTGTVQSTASPPSKTRPRSPTRPVRLPASATAQTASSAAKTGVTRSPSRASVNQTGLSRNASTLKRADLPTQKARNSVGNLSKRTSRVSLGSQTHDNGRPKSRLSVGSKPPDDSFLARMMRPTTSSAQRTHEKAEVDSSPKSKGKAIASRAKLSKPSPAPKSPRAERAGSIITRREDVVPALVEDAADIAAPSDTDLSLNPAGAEESEVITAPAEEVVDPVVPDMLGDLLSTSEVAKDGDTMGKIETPAASALPSDLNDDAEALGAHYNVTITSSPKGVDDAPVSAESEDLKSDANTTEANTDLNSAERRDENLSKPTYFESEALSVADDQTTTPTREVGMTAETTDEINKAMETF